MAVKRPILQLALSRQSLVVTGVEEFVYGWIEACLVGLMVNRCCLNGQTNLGVIHA
jgi:hypothetical protein